MSTIPGPWYGCLASLAVWTALCGGSVRAADEPTDLDEKVLKSARVPTDATGLLNFFRQQTLSEADRVNLQRHIRQLGSSAFADREAASRALLERGTPALHFLRDALHDADLEVARRAGRCIDEIEQGPGATLPIAAVHILVRLRPEGAVATLLRYLPYAEDSLVEEEVLVALKTLAGRQGKPEPNLIQSLHDTQPAVRGAAAYVLGRWEDRDQRAGARKLLTDPDARVRLRAAQGLVAGQEKEAVPVLVDLLSVAPDEATWQAEELLLRLAGDKAPTITAGDGSKEARQKQRDAWAAWWRANGDKTVLTGLDEDRPYLNLTTLAQMDTGKVWEMGRDGKPRWTITGLSGPIDASVVAGNRVLIAEHGGNRVTERDLKGQIIWEKKLTDSPIACQRLANGNTFIGTYGSVMEVARDGKEIYRHTVVGRVYGAERLRNGRILTVTLEGTITEMDALTGKTLRSFPGIGNGCYSIEGLPGGRILVANYNLGKVVELDANGKKTWECSVPGAYHATRLPNGNTLIASHSGQRVVEVGRDGKTVWEQGTTTSVWRVRRR